jgi:UDP-N-acetylglucosamine 2-epimerase (non-hydrolysing)
MKIAPVMAALRRYQEVQQLLIHTGQHYDDALSKVFFEELALPRPDEYLGIGSGSHAEQTARVMMAFEDICLEREPDMVVVVGDVNSTVACSLVAAKLGIKLAHVEAGLRSFDWTMPEEINRVVTDRLADLLFTTERGANENLEREGVARERIHFVGNVMIDTLLQHRQRAPATETLERFDLTARRYALVTLHRPSNVDAPESLAPILDGLARIAEDMPVLFPAHPRTQERLTAFGLRDRLKATRVIEPLGYLEFLGLMAEAAVVLTDSGGIQEETTVLGVPCLTLRRNTERPVTVEEGTNRLVELDSDSIVRASHEAYEKRNGVRPPQRTPELWDGHAAERIARIMVEGLAAAAD